jgi:hypothetical protein
MTYGNFSQPSSVGFAPASVCFEEQQLRTLEETVLRTGCILTRGHPLQGSVKGLSEFIGVSRFRGLQSPPAFCRRGGLK